MLDSIPGEEKGVEAGKEREVPKGGDIVICEVDCILILLEGLASIDWREWGAPYLGNTQVLNRGYFVPYTTQKKNDINPALQKCSNCPFQTDV